ncbi:BQ5605_C033g11177 [Microbotryum silenes-dioicae]|uniref:BQ5605_C033g11177 protein n=1 Tax=Microbotryum silenes-dioicae TaxID=796604 RepID=A0A2X0MGX6_9BASI|nr:BQ5605_C033g11177 [Microbotryum silenes-dioicae]
MRAMYLSLITFALTITVVRGADSDGNSTCTPENCPSGNCDGNNCLAPNVSGCGACDNAIQHCYGLCNQPQTCPIQCRAHCDSIKRLCRHDQGCDI